MKDIIGVVGSGQMGSGIVQVALLSGFPVVWKVGRTEREQGAANELEQSWKLLRDKGQVSARAVTEAGSLLTISAESSRLQQARVVIEAVKEDVSIKQSVLAELDRICSPETILASNTSSLPITRLASATSRPDLVIGMHFMNPPLAIKLLEVIKGYLTSDATISRIMELGRALGRKPIQVVKDYCGFANTQLLIRQPDSKIGVPALIREVNQRLWLLVEGRATVEDVEGDKMAAYGAPLGPLALLDFIGLDTFLSVECSMYEEYGVEELHPHPLLLRLVEAGHLGLKTGIGFYDYSKNPGRAIDFSPTFLRFITTQADETPIAVDKLGPAGSPERQ